MVDRSRALTASKYQIAAIEVTANKWFLWATQNLFESSTILTELGSWLHANEFHDLLILSYVWKLVRSAMREQIAAIMASEEAWATLYANEKFLRDVMADIVLHSLVG